MHTARMRTARVVPPGGAGSSSRAAAPGGSATTACSARTSQVPSAASTSAPLMRPWGTWSVRTRARRRTWAPSARAAAAIASISWPMPWAGKWNPSGAAWSSSSRRARSPGMRSRGSPSTFSRYGRITRSTKAAPNRQPSSPAADTSRGAGGSGVSGRWSR